MSMISFKSHYNSVRKTLLLSAFIGMSNNLRGIASNSYGKMPEGQHREINDLFKIKRSAPGHDQESIKKKKKNNPKTHQIAQYSG